ncbi:MAG TPA: PD-(D/E)XK nuclease family protein [Leptolyngbyaceae cyanobacterium M33_DOE_097]|uniref:PD-(D/E)XK nuclease family protein n=1 Tax=Oscillatoriales cyanobacterium SpSt-418 TaxID=2282169 RepID=A0A7C3PEJ5_9CYAN|nr:PD-(D/E)XK nuclease family protein [Leptolyngbyaceae cyanobacterium M33_DOE_097]
MVVSPYRLHLSQTQLNLLSVCPRKYQHTYLEQLGLSLDADQQEKRQLGEQFHQLMQQHLLGLNIEPLLQAEPALVDYFQAFLRSQSEIVPTEADAYRQSECSVSIEFQGYLLTAVYDLLITGLAEARILDWKTYPKPLQARKLIENWQTRLYLFVLAEASGYEPEQLSMTYWFFQAAGDREAQKLHLPYSKKQHEQTYADLTQQLDQLTLWLEQYNQGVDFPQVPTASTYCPSCHFAVRCDRPIPASEAQSELTVIPDLTTIQEIPI